MSGPSYPPAPTGPFEPPGPPPALSGPLSLHIAYPPVEGHRVHAGEVVTMRTRDNYGIQSDDSTFVFGSVGTADADLTVNGEPVPVYPSGGWIAWLPLPNDSVM